ncbi:hypothetical protein I204_05217 [Kwoniella mangroviensis CBS 8886]|nr:hypothetical protein I204_05217 [Kwoniella mangroviensis CBS 8886]
MPTPSTRRDLLRKIQFKIDQTCPKISLPYYHSQYLWLLSLRRNISSSRYWDRLPAYWSHDYLDEQQKIIPSTDKEALKRFRCTLSEFDNLVQEFGDDPVFKSKNHKAQCHVGYLHDKVIGIGIYVMDNDLGFRTTISVDIVGRIWR